MFDPGAEKKLLSTKDKSKVRCWNVIEIFERKLSVDERTIKQYVKKTKRENDRSKVLKEIKSTRSAVFIRPHYSGKA